MAKKWYVIQTYSGYEKKVKSSLIEHMRLKGMEDRFGEILIPTEAVQDVTPSGKPRTKEKTSLPGYLFVEMEMSEDAWYLVKETAKVTGFIGNQTPTPVRQTEIDALRLGAGSATPGGKPIVTKANYQPGDEVRVIEGAFENFSGRVEEVKPEKSKLKVRVSIFGRETPVELDFSQVEKR
ncbi:MAG: transcription termination/antitermination protein NusG [Myxococcales bacterium]|nr:MAG: transcription termination/antitermination protein NusG [Myxococcales bacterium]